jgi:hypothetical protein
MLVRTSVAVLPLLLAFKAAVTGIILWFMREYGSRTLYYYTNRGLSPRELWGWSLAIDATIFFICIAAAAIWMTLWTA